MTLYRQYRPQQFSELVGQKTVCTLLQNALKKDQVAHAYLFSGPRGTGKTTTARIFARAITCLSPIVKGTAAATLQYEPCNQCEACLSQLNGTATDTIEIDAASNRTIDDVRELREQVLYPPVSLKRKIYIIDEVHMLTVDAFNALLKTLEEPHSHVVFILATTELHKVPGTIRSRCQLVKFDRGSTESIVKKLERICKNEGWDFEEEALTVIAEHADGAFRDAEGLLEQLATQHGKVTRDAAIDGLGIIESSFVSSLLELVMHGKLAEVRDQLHAVEVEGRVRPDFLLSRLVTLTQERLYTANPTEFPALTVALENLLEAQILTKSSPRPYLPLTIACLKIASAVHGNHPHAIPQLVPKGIIADPPKHTKELSAEAKVSTIDVIIEPVNVPTEPVAPVVELRDGPLPDVRKVWREIISDIARDNAPLGQMLREAVFHSLDGTTITIHVRFKFHAEKLGEKKNRILVESYLQKATGQNWSLHYQHIENMPKRPTARGISGTSGTTGSNSAADAAAAVFTS